MVRTMIITMVVTMVITTVMTTVMTIMAISMTMVMAMLMTMVAITRPNPHLLKGRGRSPPKQCTLRISTSKCNKIYCLTSP